MRYNEHLLPALRGIPGITWNSEIRRWLLPATAEAYRQAIQALSLQSPQVSRSVSLLPEPVVRALEAEENRARTAQEEVRTRIGNIESTEIWKSMKDFQRTGVTEAVKRQGRMLLGDEMGLGKTIQALGVALAYAEEWPVLVVCPSSLRLTWKAEIKQWLGLRDYEIHVSFTTGDFRYKRAQALDTERNKRRKTMFSEKNFYIISYDLATKQIEDIKAAQFAVVICDESHYLKSTTVNVFLLCVKYKTHEYINTLDQTYKSPYSSHSKGKTCLIAFRHACVFEAYGALQSDICVDSRLISVSPQIRWTLLWCQIANVWLEL